MEQYVLELAVCGTVCPITVCVWSSMSSICLCVEQFVLELYLCGAVCPRTVCVWSNCPKTTDIYFHFLPRSGEVILIVYHSYLLHLIHSFDQMISIGWVESDRSIAKHIH